MKLIKTVCFATVAIPCLALLGCGSKPPSCSDAQTLSTAKKILVDNLSTTVNKKLDDPNGLIQNFIDGLKVQINSVVSEGYKEDAKKQLCKGTMTITAITGDTAEREVEYSTQATEDKNGGFLLEIQDFQPFVNAMSSHLNNYYIDNRWRGAWNGTYSCNGIQGANDGPQGPFSMPVSVMVDGIVAKLERTTIGGGIEKLTGAFSFDGAFALVGSGENTPEDRWSTTFSGEYLGKKVTAAGEIKLPDGTVLRQCKIDLTMAASSPK